MNARPSLQDRGRGRSRGRGGRYQNTAQHIHHPTAATSSTSTSTSTPHAPPATPPPHHLLTPSTPVAIILKQDQSSGHRVTGLLSDVLTRGSHPRGVKVRLRDGRVGRVQAIVGLDEGLSGEAMAMAAGGERIGREMDGYFYDEERREGAGREVCLGLFAALEDADKGVGRDRRRRGRRARGGAGGDVELELESAVAVAKCPVCGEFEGDEPAVAHHVEQHFAL